MLLLLLLFPSRDAQRQLVGKWRSLSCALVRGVEAVLSVVSPLLLLLLSLGGWVASALVVFAPLRHNFIIIIIIINLSRRPN
jgi:hypothetical protein